MKRNLHHVDSADVNTEKPTLTDIPPWPKYIRPGLVPWTTAQSDFQTVPPKTESHLKFIACRKSCNDYKLEPPVNDDCRLNISTVIDYHADSKKKLNESSGKDCNNTKIECTVNEKVKNDTHKDTKRDLLVSNFKWSYITQENLNLKYAKVFSSIICNFVLDRLEKEIEYFSGDLLKVRVFGKWHSIPRKQVAFGEEGLSYAFSGNSLPAKPWNTCSIVSQLKDSVESITGEAFNFVLINRYANGLDHMGEHRDDEKDLVPQAPIASLSFGEERQFIFKHKDSRGKNAKRNIPPLKVDLESGSLLLMEYPTNKFWYHSLPVRKNASNVRINLTFRKMVSQR